MKLLNKLSRKKNAKGFTLVELMIVVAIIGVLAALSIYGVSKYLANAKSAEARNALGAIAKGAVSAWEVGSMSGAILAAGTTVSGANEFCPGAENPVPAAIPSGSKAQSAGSDWSDDSGWSCLKFNMTGAQFYQYNYTSTGTTFSAVAQGNLDGDSDTSKFELLGELQGDQVTIAPAIIETNPEE